MPIGHLYVLFRKVSVQAFCPLFEWVVCSDTIKCHKLFVNFVTNPLSATSFANIFSQSVGCLFSVLFLVSFAVQELLSLSRSHLFIFAFISIILGNGLKKMLL